MKPAVRVAFYAGLVALVLQAFSAAQRDFPSLESPNASTTIGLRLAKTGELSSRNWGRFRGQQAELPSEPLRSFHLPGHPLFLAPWFWLLPKGAWLYLHVPVTALLIAAIALLGALIGGARVGAIAGGIACLHPFMIAHGPVHDDIFLGTAFDLWLIALCALWLIEAPRGAMRVVYLALIALCAGWSCLVRSQSQLLIGALACLPWVVAAFRPLRPAGIAALAAAALAIGGWGARNQRVLGEFFVGSTHDGITLWESNYPHAWEAIGHGSVETLNDRYMQDDFAKLASAGELESNRYFVQRAKAYMLANPVDVIWLSVRKVTLTLLGVAPQLPWSHRSNLLRALGSALPLLLGLYALRYLSPRTLSPAQRFIALASVIAVLATLVLCAVGPVGVRYRFPAEWLTWIAVAFLIDRAIARFRPAANPA